MQTEPISDTTEHTAAHSTHTDSGCMHSAALAPAKESETGTEQHHKIRRQPSHLPTGVHRMSTIHGAYTVKQKHACPPPSLLTNHTGTVGTPSHAH